MTKNEFFGSSQLFSQNQMSLAMNNDEKERCIQNIENYLKQSAILCGLLPDSHSINRNNNTVDSNPIDMDITTNNQHNADYVNQNNGMSSLKSFF